MQESDVESLKAYRRAQILQASQEATRAAAVSDISSQSFHAHDRDSIYQRPDEESQSQIPPGLSQQENMAGRTQLS
ncbi:hypothetical protein ACQY0O_004494 [Thecaphora frezii]